MAWQTTVIELSTTPTAIISTATTWANLRGATLYDPVPLLIVNESTVLPVRIGGNAAASGTTGAGVPLGISGGTVNYTLLADGALFGWTTASTGRVTVQAGRN